MKMIFRILLLINLISGISGTFVVNVTQTSYQAEENHNITLEWTFSTKPHTSSKSLFIYCGLITDLKSSVSESQDQQFSGRVHFDQNVLSDGQIKLQLSRLRTNDSGLYRCVVKTDCGRSSAECQLNVTAADHPEPVKPSVSPEPESRGWIGFYIGLGLTAAVLLVPLCFALSRCLTKSTDKTEHSSSVDQHVNVSEISLLPVPESFDPVGP
ncbi:hypothetical protein Q5P01_000152 [Channa striata]|uniref:Ig-like domain-containing protein n=1 Tax=Channa striata TaxID=64152 RepID=A0AA88IHU9_CHASR|nr:hypothetical protein Q5P01_000152 [Channa striata]